MLVYWKHLNYPDFVGENIEFFRVTWSGYQWLRDVDGKWWGVEHPNGRRNIRLMLEPENYGEVVVEDKNDVDISVPEVVVGTPELNEFEEVDTADGSLTFGEEHSDLDYE